MWLVSCRRQGMVTQGPAPDPKCKSTISSFFALPYLLDCLVCTRNAMPIVLLLQIMGGGIGGRCLINISLWVGGQRVGIILQFSLEKGECFDFNDSLGCVYPTLYIIRLLRRFYHFSLLICYPSSLKIIDCLICTRCLRCIRTPLNLDLLQCLLNLSILCFFVRQIQTYSDKRSFFPGINTFWIVQNNKPVIDAMNGLNKRRKATFVSTYDFSTLYTINCHIINF